MNIMSIVIIAFAIGAVAVVGFSIVNYMSSLVKNAYEIKVTMRKDLDDGLKQAQSEMVKVSKSIRAELSTEAERTRNNMTEDLKKRFEDAQTTLTAELEKRDAAWQEEREELMGTIIKLTGQVEAMSHSPSARIWNKAKAAEAAGATEASAMAAANPPSSTPQPTPKPADATETAATALPLAAFDSEHAIKNHAN